ncbi:hypothetical protein K2173_012298 [Erythroxylum novogranatense]|uniref:Polygalacturonase n=1 Tax=Erythroxylum novogranatense TaxID=1862640 RepID=A0AAV8SC74_9ROSI|nr:hypothetical protein K2173_012298 [Erythroxylum novogranatense]
MPFYYKLFDNILLGYITTSSNCRPLNVLEFGATGDGNTDDTQAFEVAWKAVCQGTNSNTLTIPQGKTFLLKSVNFNGPCQSQYINIKLQGSVVAPNNMSQLQELVWIQFSRINGLTVDGKGLINGRGDIWWEVCKKAIIFSECNGLQLSHLNLMNAPFHFIKIYGCENSVISNLRISAPRDSPNTDGINIGSSKNITILDSQIATGDDCISILPGSSAVNISGITCGPGHGISIGSIGHDGETGEVEEVYITHSTFTAVTSGARIKTWQGGKGSVRKISYEYITLVNSSTPIVLDQFYCPEGNCPNKTEAVAISDITFASFHGTSPSPIPIELMCSQSIGCTNLVLNNIKISSSVAGQDLTSNTFNAHGTASDTVPSVTLLH